MEHKIVPTGPERLSGRELDNEYIADSVWVVQDYFRSRRQELIEAWQAGGMDVEYKTDQSPFTQLDRAVESGFKSQLRQFDQHVSFIGEEFGREGVSHTLWLIDPIDGTRAFIAGEPGWTNMATLVHDHRAVAAVIYDALNDTMYSATEQGVMVNGEPLNIPSYNRPSRLYVDSDLAEAIESVARSSGFEIVPHDEGRYSGQRWIGMATGSIDAYIALGARSGLHDIGPLYIAQQSGIGVKSIRPVQGHHARLPRLEAWDALYGDVIATRNPDEDVYHLRRMIMKYREAAHS